MRLCAASRPVSILPLSSSVSPGFQLATSSRVSVSRFDAPRRRRRRPVDLRPVGRATAARASPGPLPSSTKCAWRVAAQFGIIATGLRRRVRRVIVDLDVEHGRQAAEALRADAERVDLVVQLDAQLLESCSRAARACSSCMSIGSISASLASSIAFSAVPPMPMPSMPGGHQPAPIVGTVFSTQSTIESRRVQHRELGLVLRAAALGRDRDVDRVARHELDV